MANSMITAYQRMVLSTFMRKLFQTAKTPEAVMTLNGLYGSFNEGVDEISFSTKLKNVGLCGENKPPRVIVTFAANGGVVEYEDDNDVAWSQKVGNIEWVIKNSANRIEEMVEVRECIESVEDDMFASNYQSIIVNVLEDKVIDSVVGTNYDHENESVDIIFEKAKNAQDSYIDKITIFVNEKKKIELRAHVIEFGADPLHLMYSMINASEVYEFVDETSFAR